MVFFETLVKWSEASTIHGVIYAVEPKRNIFLRLLWLLILSAAAFLAVYMSVIIFNYRSMCLIIPVGARFV